MRFFAKWLKLLLYRCFVGIVAVVVGIWMCKWVYYFFNAPASHLNGHHYFEKEKKHTHSMLSFSLSLPPLSLCLLMPEKSTCHTFNHIKLPQSKRFISKFIRIAYICHYYSYLTIVITWFFCLWISRAKKHNNKKWSCHLYIHSNM